MDSKLTTAADARRRLNNSADGVASVREFIEQSTPKNLGGEMIDPKALDAMEYLAQVERVIRNVGTFGCLKGE